jgi:hypothetical protein
MISGKIISYSFIFVIIALFFYSFTQVDLSLTLSQASFLQTIQKSFQQVGYFNRPLSTVFYLLILGLLTLYSLYFLRLSLKNKLNIKLFRNLVLLTAGILSFSYVAFSYDLFNYIFDAKIITHYGDNPYFHKALDYPNDPMLSFMRWTHRLYPYGPIWLILTVPVSLLGLKVFLITFFLFKFLAAAFYLGSVYLIYKITQKINPGYEIFNAVLFAFNPLVIVESLVSSHNDIAMVFFALFGLYLYFVKSKILGIVFVVISALIKIPTAVLLLPMVINFLPNRRYNLSPQKFIWLSVVLAIIGLFYSMTKLEIQPWYFLWILPFAALLKPNKYVIALILGTSLGLLLRYTVLLYYGNWDGFLVTVRNVLTIIPIILSVIIAFCLKNIKKL